MRIDKTQRGWAIASLTILAVATTVYAVATVESPGGPRGGSAAGLAFGVFGFGFMVFAALLGARKRVPTWRLGRAQAWMRGHLWLGFLSVPMILLHGGFQFGGTLTRVLMWLLITTVVSGVFGAAMQHYVPRVMTSDVTLETIYDEIANVRKSLIEEADCAVEMLCGSLGLSSSATEDVQRAGGFSAARATVTSASGGTVAIAEERVVLKEGESTRLKTFYLTEMRPFLQQPKLREASLRDRDKAHNAFVGLETLLPAAVRGTLEDLEDVCDEARQLVRQEQLHHWLHAWLLVHIPLSLALIVLGAIHAVTALKY